MNATAKDLADAVALEAGNELRDALKKIRHCVDQLEDQQLWWRPSESMNSVANLMLHLCGNVRQWIISGMGGAQDHRDRPAEFAERGPVERDELIQRLEAVVNEARAALSSASANDLVERRRIQGFDVTGMQAIFESVAHFRGHTQEIVHMTRCQLGQTYKFDFVPSGSEQGAPE